MNAEQLSSWSSTRSDSPRLDHAWILKVSSVDEQREARVSRGRRTWYEKSTRRSWDRIPGDVWRQKWFPTASSPRHARRERALRTSTLAWLTTIGNQLSTQKGNPRRLKVNDYNRTTGAVYALYQLSG